MMRESVYILLLACGGFLGCDSSTKGVSSAKREAIAECGRFLSDAQHAYDGRSKLYERIGNALRELSDSQERGDLIKSLVSEVLRTDLSLHDKGYRDWCRRVSTYEYCRECIEDYIFSPGLDGRCALESYFACMKKLREACFSVSMAGRLKDEDKQTFDERCYAVWDVMDVYQKAMRLWELNMNKHLQVLPESLRNEYIERRRPFMEYTSGRKLRESMMLGRDISK